MRYWIRDEDATPQGFPLKVLIMLIIHQIAPLAYQVWILRSQGYGLTVNEWDDRLDKEERLPIDLESLLGISSGEEEWFYDLDAEIIADGLQVRFGLHDSTALYIDAPQAFSEKIVETFKNVTLDGAQGGA